MNAIRCWVMMRERRKSSLKHMFDRTNVDCIKYFKHRVAVRLVGIGNNPIYQVKMILFCRSARPKYGSRPFSIICKELLSTLFSLPLQHVSIRVFAEYTSGGIKNGSKSYWFRFCGKRSQHTPVHRVTVGCSDEGVKCEHLAEAFLQRGKVARVQ